jgi:dTDP-4-dehydrorhamnose 3,5-epimerase
MGVNHENVTPGTCFFDYYHPEFERSLLWSDPTVGIQWPEGIAPLLAAKDAAAKQLGAAEVFD